VNCSGERGSAEEERGGRERARETGGGLKAGSGLSAQEGSLFVGTWVAEFIRSIGRIPPDQTATNRMLVLTNTPSVSKYKMF
jgi:hypothetical protein